MLFGTSKRLKNHGRDLIIKYKGKIVTFATNYIYLGHTLDGNMTLNDNFDIAYRKASSRLQLL